MPIGTRAHVPIPPIGGGLWARCAPPRRHHRPPIRSPAGSPHRLCDGGTMRRLCVDHTGAPTSWPTGPPRSDDPRGCAPTALSPSGSRPVGMACPTTDSWQCRRVHESRRPGAPTASGRMDTMRRLARWLQKAGYADDGDGPRSRGWTPPPSYSSTATSVAVTPCGTDRRGVTYASSVKPGSSCGASSTCRRRRRGPSPGPLRPRRPVRPAHWSMRRSVS